MSQLSQNNTLKLATLKNTMVRDNLKDSSFLNAIAQGMNKKSSGDKLVLYRMKRKESLADISKEKNIPLEELMGINDVNPEKGLAPGSLIKLSR